MSTTLNLAATKRLAVTAAELAEQLGISERHLWAQHASGKIPRPIRLGRAVRWNLAEIQAWLDAGAPSCEAWGALREEAGA